MVVQAVKVTPIVATKIQSSMVSDSLTSPEYDGNLKKILVTAVPMLKTFIVPLLNAVIFISNLFIVQLLKTQKRKDQF